MLRSAEANRLEIGPTDREILARCAEGDPSWFVLLYDRYAAALYFFAHSLLEDRTLAEDLVQDSLLRLLDRPVEGLEDSVRSLLYTILRNLAIDESRRRRIRERSYPSLSSSGGSPDRPLPPDELEDLSRALHALPREQRETVVLKCYGELTFGQIAGLLGVPEPTVKSRYRYALDKLGQLLEKEEA